MKTVLSRMKNGKAVGEDEIPVEMHKASGNEVIRWLTDIQSGL